MKENEVLGVDGCGLLPVLLCWLWWGVLPLSWCPSFCHLGFWPCAGHHIGLVIFVQSSQWPAFVPF